MPFTFSDRHIEEYYHHGYTVFRGILPVSLISDLRRSLEVGRQIAHEKGPFTQRLQPMNQYSDQIDMKPLEDYTHLPVLVDACKRVLSDRHQLMGLDSRLGVFYEPRELPYSTNWHRDITATTNGVDAPEFEVIDSDPTFFTQVNCALYTDTSTWYVPSSAGRPNVHGETEVAAQKPDLDGKSFEERERLGIEYCRKMPGAVQLILEPGDFALYRPNGWHIGNYSPLRKRMTLHDSVWKPETIDWYKSWRKNMDDIQKLKSQERKAG